VNDFDIYVGTSAGALVSALLANGLSPEMMLQSFTGDGEIPPIAREEVFSTSLRDLIRLGRRLPRTAVRAVSHYLRHSQDMDLFDAAWSLLEALPAGLFDNLALERYLRRTIARFGRSNHFADLAPELHIIATDLDNSQRTVFSRDSHPDIPISLAVAASTAVPLLYKPVRIHGRDYVDGGLRGNASLDLAVEQGAELIVCINPLVPYDNDSLKSIPFLGPDGGHLSDKGLSAIANQVSRIYSHAGLHYHLKQLRRTHPEVDIILIEPSRRDYQMFFYNIMRYSARLTVARHGFETVTLELAENFAYYEELLARHDIALSRRLVIEELEEIRASNYDARVIRRVLDARSAAYRRRGPGSPVKQLQRTLASLDQALDQLAKQPAAGAGA
jgi:NTE family protein